MVALTSVTKKGVQQVLRGHINTKTLRMLIFYKGYHFPYTRGHHVVDMAKATTEWINLSILHNILGNHHLMWLSMTIDCNYRLWYPELASGDVRCHVHLSLGSKLSTVGPLCTGMMSAWLSPAWSRHSHTVPLGLHMSTITPLHSFIYCWLYLGRSVLCIFMGLGKARNHLLPVMKKCLHDILCKIIHQWILVYWCY